jgi:hypothetical protein
MDAKTLKSELISRIDQKLNWIKEKSNADSGNLKKDIQILLMVSDELDDVLLNWEEPPILNVGNNDFDFEDDDY